MLKYSTADDDRNVAVHVEKAHYNTEYFEENVLCARSLYSQFPLFAEGKNAQVKLTIRVPPNQPCLQSTSREINGRKSFETVG